MPSAPEVDEELGLSEARGRLLPFLPLLPFPPLPRKPNPKGTPIPLSFADAEEDREATDSSIMEATDDECSVTVERLDRVRLGGAGTGGVDKDGGNGQLPVVAGAAEEANGGRPFEIVLLVVVLEAAEAAGAEAAGGGERPKGKASSSSWSRMLLCGYCFQRVQGETQGKATTMVSDRPSNCGPTAINLQIGGWKIGIRQQERLRKSI